MSESTKSFVGAAFFLVAAAFFLIYGTPSYSSLHSIQGKVDRSYEKRTRFKTSRTEYAVIEIESDSNRYIVFIELGVKSFKQIKVGDIVSVKARLAPSRRNYHAWELVVNGRSEIEYSDLIQLHRITNRAFVYLFSLIGIILFISGIYHLKKLSPKK